MLRIALLKRDLHAGGGLEKYFRKIYSALVVRGHVVKALSMDFTKEIAVTKLGSKKFFSFLSMIWFDLRSRFWLKKNPQDIVFGLDRHFLALTHYRAGNGCHAAFLERRKKESSWIKRLLLYCNPLHRVTLFSEKRTFESANTKIICNSHLVRNEIVRFYQKSHPENIVVIHNGVEWDEFEKPFCARVEDSLIPQLLFVGHEWQRKGLDRLLKALAFVKSPFFFTAIGRERHPKKFQALLNDLRLEQKVQLISRAQNPIAFYQKSSIMIIPSRYDPFANVTLEALAMGLFVITTEANGGSEILSSENGRVLPENATPVDFAQAIEEALISLKEGHIQASTIRESVKKYDFSKQLGELVEFLELS